MFVFFGLVATAGSYYVQTLRLGPRPPCGGPRWPSACWPRRCCWPTTCGTWPPTPSPASAHWRSGSGRRSAGWCYVACIVLPFLGVLVWACGRSPVTTPFVRRGPPAVGGPAAGGSAGAAGHRARRRDEPSCRCWLPPADCSWSSAQLPSPCGSLCAAGHPARLVVGLPRAGHRPVPGPAASGRRTTARHRAGLLQLGSVAALRDHHLGGRRPMASHHTCPSGANLASSSPVTTSTGMVSSPSWSHSGTWVPVPASRRLEARPAPVLVRRWAVHRPGGHAGRTSDCPSTGPRTSRPCPRAPRRGRVQLVGQRLVGDPASAAFLGVLDPRRARHQHEAVDELGAVQRQVQAERAPPSSSRGSRPGRRRPSRSAPSARVGPRPRPKRHGPAGRRHHPVIRRQVGVQAAPHLSGLGEAVGQHHRRSLAGGRTGQSRTGTSRVVAVGRWQVVGHGRSRRAYR